MRSTPKINIHSEKVTCVLQMEMLNIFSENLWTDKLEYEFAMKMSLQIGWIIEDKTNINLGAFLPSENILEANYILWKKLLKYYKAVFFSPFHALNLLPYGEDQAEYAFFSQFFV